MKQVYFVILIISFFNSCTLVVGGNCNYQKTEGTAKVKSINNEYCIVDFYIYQEAGSAWRLEKYFENIEANCVGKVQVGEEYSATYSKASHGSCTPYFLIVNDNRSRKWNTY